MRYIKLLVRFIFAFVVALGVALYLMQHEPWFKKNMESKVKYFFCTTYQARLDGELDGIDLFSPKIILKNARVTPLDGSTAWTWQATQGTVYFSWLDLVTHGALNIRVALKGFKAYSDVEQTTVAIADHLGKLFFMPDLGIPAIFKELQIHDGVIELFEKNKLVRMTIPLRVATKRIGKLIKTSFYLSEGSATKEDVPWIERAEGSLLVDIAETPEGLKSKIESSLSFDLPHLGQAQTCHLAGTWDYDHASMTLCNNDRSLVLDPITIDQNYNVACNLKAPLAYVQHFLPLPADPQANGVCSLSLTANLKNIVGTVQAEASVKNAQYKKMTLSSAAVQAHASSAGVQGTVALEMTKDVALSGTWQWRQQTGVQASLENIKTVTMPGLWELKPHKLRINAHVDPAGAFHSSYTCSFTKQHSHNVVHCSGAITKKEDTFFIEGRAGNDTYEVAIATRPLMLQHFVYKNKQGVLAQLSTDAAHKKSLEGTIDYALLYSFLPKELKKELLGSGVFKIKATYDTNGVHGTIAMDHASMRIPKLYNFIGSLNTQFSWDAHRNKLVLSDLVCGLHRGTMTSKRITAFLDENYALTFVHAPVTLNACFVSWQKDLFATVSGNLLFKFRKDEPSLLSGALFVDRSQLKGNIFSRDLQQSMLLMSDQPLPTKTYDLLLDVNVLTREPLRIKTSFIEARTIFDITIKKSLASPEVAGKIELIQGELKFPYKPLSIVSGVIDLVPQQIYDPLIELVAKGKIKKYGIGLYVTGSVQNPHIHFEASPTLTEEQIVALLLTGAQDSSLNILVPALIMKNVQQVIFGPAKSPSKLQSYFKSLLKPLSYVRIVPSFTDETGRGGLRAALEIEVNDQLSAVIEKNFSLSEDVKFEINYALSDDISLKGVQDERGDFGGEMEVKWKF
jgi:hypothetical protein